PGLAHLAPCSPFARDSASLAADLPAVLGAHLVAGTPLGGRYLLGFHGHILLRAHSVGVRTDSALAGSFAYGRSGLDDPPFHSKERARHGIFCVLPATLSRRAR